MNEKQPSPSGQAGTSKTARGANLATSPTAGPAVEASKAIADDVKHVATEVAAQAKQQVTSQIEEKKDRAAQGLGSVAAAIRKTGEGLRDHDELGVTKYADGLADQIERLSKYVTSSNVSELLGGAEGFARREPVIFLSGAFLLGVVGARFLKASVPTPTYAGGYASVDDPYDRGRDEPRSIYGRDEPRSAYKNDGVERAIYGGSYDRREGASSPPYYATEEGREGEFKPGTTLPGTGTPPPEAAGSPAGKGPGSSGKP